MDLFSGLGIGDGGEIEQSLVLSAESTGSNGSGGIVNSPTIDEDNDDDELIVSVVGNRFDISNTGKGRNKKERQRKLSESGLPIRNRKKIKRAVKTYGLGVTKKGTVRLKAKPYRILPGSLWSKVQNFCRNPEDPVPEGLPPSPPHSIWNKKRSPIKINTALHRDRDSANAIAAAAETAKLGDLAGFGGIMADVGDVNDSMNMGMTMGGPTDDLDDMFNANYDGVFGDVTDYGPGDLSMFEGGLSAALGGGTTDNVGDRSQFDMMLTGSTTTTTVTDDFSGAHRASYAGAYKWTPKTIYSLTDDRAFYDAMRLCGTDLFLISAHLRGWTYDQVKKKYNTEIKRNPGLAKEILLNAIPFSTRPWQDTHKRKIDPSKHFRPEIG